MPRSCGGVSESVNLPLKAAKITQGSLDPVVLGPIFSSCPKFSDLLGLSEHSDLFILFDLCPSRFFAKLSPISYGLLLEILTLSLLANHNLISMLKEKFLFGITSCGKEDF